MSQCYKCQPQWEVHSNAHLKKFGVGCLLFMYIHSFLLLFTFFILGFLGFYFFIFCKRVVLSINFISRNIYLFIYCILSELFWVLQQPTSVQLFGYPKYKIIPCKFSMYNVYHLRNFNYFYSSQFYAIKFIRV